MARGSHSKELGKALLRRSKRETLERLSLHPLELKEALGAAMETGSPPEMDRKSASERARGRPGAREAALPAGGADAEVKAGLATADFTKFVDAQVAVAVDILLVAPLRAQNLIALNWSRNFKEPQGPRGKLLLYVPKDATKSKAARPDLRDPARCGGDDPLVSARGPAAARRRPERRPLRHQKGGTPRARKRSRSRSRRSSKRRSAFPCRRTSSAMSPRCSILTPIRRTSRP